MNIFASDCYAYVPVVSFVMFRYKNVLEGNRRSSWTKEEDLKLIALVDEIGEGNWTAIAARLEDRVDCQCLRRWSSLKA